MTEAILSHGNLQEEIFTLCCLNDPFHPWVPWVQKGILAHIYSVRSEASLLSLSTARVREAILQKHASHSREKQDKQIQSTVIV